MEANVGDTDVDAGPRPLRGHLAHRTLVDLWMAGGFTFFDNLAPSGRSASQERLSTPEPEKRGESAERAGADVVLMGTVVATTLGDLADFMGVREEGPKVNSCKGSISMRAVDARSGEILAATVLSELAIHGDEAVCLDRAVIAATQAFADDMQKKLLEAWNRK